MVDVVVRLHGLTDQAPKLWHLRVLAHIQLDDVPRTPIQPSIKEEFRQHDGVMTMLMFYRCRALPKHRYSIIEVDYGGGGHHTGLRDQEINCCVFGVPPAPIYNGAKEGRGGRPGGVLLPSGVGLPPFLVGLGEGVKEEGERKERGAPPPYLVQFRVEGEGRAALPWSTLISLH